MEFRLGPTKARAALGVLLMLLTIEGARAQEPSPDQLSAIRSSCHSDFMANCSGVTPGGKDALECLMRNLAKLSGACKSAVSAITPAPPAASSPAPAAAAPAAAPQAAPAVPPAAGKPAKPATAPAAKLTPAPSAPPPPPAAAAPAVAPLHVRPFIMPERRIAIMAICHADTERLCSGILPIGSGVFDCLAEKASSLTPSCYDALARISMP
jgi:Cysteine rich repeat